MWTRLAGIRRWMGRRVLLSLVLGALLAIVTPLWFAARGEPRLGAERWAYPWSGPPADGTTFTRFYTRSNAWAIERSWQDEIAGSKRFGDCGAGLLSEVIDKHIHWLSAWRAPHASEPWGSLPTDRERYGDLVRSRFMELPGTQGFEVAYGWPRLALARGRYDGTDTQPLGVGWSYMSYYPGGRWHGGFMVPLTPIWSGLVINTLFFSAGWLVLFAGGFMVKDWVRLRRGRCPRCRYDLRHDFSAGCPECGWRRVAADSPRDRSVACH